MKTAKTFKTSFDLDKRDTDFDIIHGRGTVTLIDNNTKKKLAFPSEIAAVNYIKNIANTTESDFVLPRPPINWKDLKTQF